MWLGEKKAFVFDIFVTVFRVEVSVLIHLTFQWASNKKAKITIKYKQCESSVVTKNNKEMKCKQGAEENGDTVSLGPLLVFY